MIDIRIEFSLLAGGEPAAVTALLDALMGALVEADGVLDAAIERDHGAGQVVVAVTMADTGVDQAVGHATATIEQALRTHRALAPAAELTRGRVTATHLTTAPGPADTPH